MCMFKLSFFTLKLAVFTVLVVIHGLVMGVFYLII